MRRFFKTSMLFMMIGIICIFCTGCEQEKKDAYDGAVLLLENGFYEQAIEVFTELGDYKDSAEKRLEAQDKVYGPQYAVAFSLYLDKQYDAAYEVFITFGDYRDSQKKAEDCLAEIYKSAIGQYDAAKYVNGQKLFSWLAERGYKDSAKQADACETAIKDGEYNAAVALMDAKKYEEAIKAFEALNGYRDSETKLDEAIGAILEPKLTSMKKATIGTIVKYGTYEQDNKTANATEEIEWIVLDKQGTKLLLISRYALDCLPYNKDIKGVTWETCTLRTWLNGTFLNAAFSAAEQKKIVQTTVQNPDNSRYKTKGGNDTQDRVFLLSIDEANKYFASNGARMCAGTAYAYAQGTDKANNGNCWWWLRSPGSDQDNAAYVSSGGYVGGLGYSVDYDYIAVRPAFWIDPAS